MEQNTHTTTQFGLKYASKLRLKVVVMGTKLSVNIILNGTEVHFKFIGTHFDQTLIKT